MFSMKEEQERNLRGFYFTLVTGPSRSLRLKLSVYAPEIRTCEDGALALDREAVIHGKVEGPVRVPAGYVGFSFQG